MKQLVIIGAGGHGRVVKDVAECVGYDNIIFLDDSEKSNPAVVGRTDEFECYINSSDFFVAIGNSEVRERISNILITKGANIVTLIHPMSAVSKSSKIGWGVVVMAGAVVNADSVIGNGVIVNTCASVDHDSIVNEFAHVSVGAHVCGAVTIGKYVWIGAGATIINNISICNDCIVGAGAVVINDIAECGTYVGAPARLIKGRY